MMVVSTFGNGFPGKWSTCPLPEKGIKKKLFLCLLLLTSTSLFKMYLADVGMLTSSYGMPTKRMLIGRDSNLNAGGIYENVMAQELCSKGYSLYYYNSNRLGELDFVIEYEGKALPIEIKSGKDYRYHSAISNCLNNSEYEMDQAFVFANCNVFRKGKIVYLPAYMIMFMDKRNEEDLVLGRISF